MSSRVEDAPRTAAPASGRREPADSAPPTVIEPPRGWRLPDVGELWRFHELIFFLAWRDVKVRYKQTLLGAAWAVLQPALMMVVFTIFFSRMAKVPTSGYSAEEYPLFVFAGLLPWTFFSTGVANAGNSLIASERLITKVYFPRLAVPLAAVGAALVDFAVASGLLGVLMLWYGHAPGAASQAGAGMGGWGLLAAPGFVVLMLLLAIGVGAFLGALNVSYRDFKYVIPFMVQLWMYATPTVYSQPTGSELGGWLHVLMVLNPMTALTAGFRAAVLGGPCDWGQVATAAAVSIAVFVGGCVYFRRAEGSFVDRI